jgi:hypothetical protein
MCIVRLIVCIIKKMVGITLLMNEHYLNESYVQYVNDRDYVLTSGVVSNRAYSFYTFFKSETVLVVVPVRRVYI